MNKLVKTRGALKSMQRSFKRDNTYSLDTLNAPDDNSSHLTINQRSLYKYTIWIKEHVIKHYLQMVTVTITCLKSQSSKTKTLVKKFLPLSKVVGWSHGDRKWHYLLPFHLKDLILLLIMENSQFWKRFCMKG